MSNTDTPHTDASIWKLTKFDSALLEHDGETLNEIHCASHDEAECLVDLLNGKSEELAASNSALDQMTENAVKLKAEVERLRRTLKFIDTDRATHDCTGFYRGIAFRALNLKHKPILNDDDRN